MPTNVVFPRRWQCVLAILLVTSSTWISCVVSGATTRTRDSTSTEKSGKDLKASSSSDDYYDGGGGSSKGYDEGQGDGGDGSNYIPFQWKVEIIKREYDDYVLPDGTVYRVPAGATPPHRHKGDKPYTVPYYVYQDKDSSHEGGYYDRPKLVETYDTQTLELLMQDWYENEYWDRKYFGANVPDDYGRHGGGVRYDNGYVTGQAPSGDGYAASDKKESRLVGDGISVPAGKSETATRPTFFMRSFNGTQRWKDLDTQPRYHASSTQYALNGTMDESSRPNFPFLHRYDDGVDLRQRVNRISGPVSGARDDSGEGQRQGSSGSRLGFGRSNIASASSRERQPLTSRRHPISASSKPDPFSKKATMDKLYAYVNRQQARSNALPSFQRRHSQVDRDE